MVYEQPQHYIRRKYVMLTNPKERLSGSMGFLKVSVMIVGEGDEVPVEDEDQHNEEEDVEANMLAPPGVTLEAVDLVVQVCGLD